MQQVVYVCDLQILDYTSSLVSMLYLHNMLVVEHRRTVVDLDHSMHSVLLQLLLHLKYVAHSITPICH